MTETCPACRSGPLAHLYPPCPNPWHAAAATRLDEEIAAAGPPPPAGPDYASIDALGLTVDERRFLASQAMYEADRQTDPRYCHPAPRERQRLRDRWREIARALHPDPWRNTE